MVVLTRGGWTALVAAVGLVGAGRVLGTYELYLLGAGLAALVGMGLVLVNGQRVRLEATRTVLPARVGVGDRARTELRLVNAGRRRSPVLRVHEPVSGTRGARLLVGPLRRDDVARAAYQLPTARRGLLAVGPLELAVRDPFGLCERRRPVLGATELVVYPPIEAVHPVAHLSRPDPHAPSSRPTTVGRAGEDFAGLRPYAIGDDLRRVHWPSVARTGELVVRQHELPRQERTTVLLDVGTGQDPLRFERAVSAAASLLVAASGAGDQVRLRFSDGSDSGFGRSRSHLDALLHRLALLSPVGEASTTAALEALRREPGGGSLVIIGTVDDAIGPSLTAAGRVFGTVVCVVFDDAPATAAGGIDLARPDGRVASVGGTRRAAAGHPQVIRCGSDRAFGACWNRSAPVAPSTRSMTDPSAPVGSGR